MSNCGCKRDIDPAGVWDYESMIGAKVRVRSMPLSNFSKLDYFGECTISDIYFRVSVDGKAITIIRLAEVPDMFFTWKDLEILKTTGLPNSICGNFKAGGGTVSGQNSD